MKNFKKIIITIFILVLIIPQLSSCVKKEETYSSSNFLLDTICEIGIYTSDEDEAYSNISLAFLEISRLEKLLSRTIEGSDVDRINKAMGSPVEVSDETIEVINLALKYASLTNGLFDLSIGKVSSLYNFRDGTTLPEKEKISEAIKHIDYTKIKVEGNTVTLLDPDMMIDLGGVAKGYIAKKTAEYLSSLGVTDATINLGGNVVALGDKDGNGFGLGVKDPSSDTGEILGAIYGSDLTIVTSGTYERYIEVDGIRYHHILDPKTGCSIDTDVIQVSVIASSMYSGDCDALSTTLLMLGKDKGLEFMKNIDFAEAIFVTDTNEVFFSNPDTDFELW